MTLVNGCLHAGDGELELVAKCKLGNILLHLGELVIVL